jgi:hypothetical protein
MIAYIHRTTYVYTLYICARVVRVDTSSSLGSLVRLLDTKYTPVCAVWHNSSGKTCATHITIATNDRLSSDGHNASHEKNIPSEDRPLRSCCGVVMMMMMTMIISSFGHLGLWAPSSWVRDAFTSTAYVFISEDGLLRSYVVARFNIFMWGTFYQLRRTCESISVASGFRSSSKYLKL